MLDIIIVGAGGFGRELHGWMWDCFSKDQYRARGFLGEDPRDSESHGVDLPVLGDPDSYEPTPNDRFLLAIGDVAARRRVVETLCSRKAEFLTLVHPTAVIAPSATIGPGVVLYPYAVVSNRAVLDGFAVLHQFASAGHDTRIGRYCNLCPYATLNGCAVVEDDVFMGTHSTVGPSNRVGRNSKICANTAVLRDVPPNSFVFGVPGKVTPLMDTT